jgi:hypothetical protein
MAISNREKEPIVRDVSQMSDVEFEVLLSELTTCPKTVIMDSLRAKEDKGSYGELAPPFNWSQINYDQ